MGFSMEKIKWVWVYVSFFMELKELRTPSLLQVYDLNDPCRKIPKGLDWCPPKFWSNPTIQGGPKLVCVEKQTLVLTINLCAASLQPSQCQVQTSQS
jgi:hypothetical protein